MATFHDLPKELRDRIWNLAIRDDYPGVHIFGSSDQAKKGESRPMTSRGDRSRDSFEPLWSGYFQNLKNDCSDENISTYLIDGGLWTACKESRRVMENHFKQLDWPVRKSLMEYHYCSKDDKYKMPSTGYFAGGANVFYARDRKFLEVDCISRPLDLKQHWQFVGPDGNELETMSMSRCLVMEVDDKIDDKKDFELDYTDLDSCPVSIGLLGWDEL
ncbi:hypothetical protein FHETE_6137 [Fusarium heterosporum]|uniref:2EXR domain-containing protein n=1 Tax=Fusarium heterosporum TaxID=42747 RepID=A0A8H5TB99_FUSHE|nr:hypothetical protein FHETE_6137 [Fusarium heterosporum]